MKLIFFSLFRCLDGSTCAHFSVENNKNKCTILKTCTMYKLQTNDQRRFIRCALYGIQKYLKIPLKTQNVLYLTVSPSTTYHSDSLYLSNSTEKKSAVERVTQTNRWCRRCGSLRSPFDSQLRGHAPNDPKIWRQLYIFPSACCVESVLLDAFLLLSVYANCCKLFLCDIYRKIHIIISIK